MKDIQFSYATAASAEAASVKAVVPLVKVMLRKVTLPEAASDPTNRRAARAWPPPMRTASASTLPAIRFFFIRYVTFKVIYVFCGGLG